MAEQVNTKALKREREQLGLNKKEMADLLGVHKSTYSRYESGDMFPGPTVMKRIASIIGEERAADIFFSKC